MKRWCGNVFSTSGRNYLTFNKIQAKSSFGRHVGGQEYALQHGGQYKSYYLVQKSECHKICPLNAFLWNFGCKIIFMRSVSSPISKISTHCLREALVTWSFSASSQESINPLLYGYITTWIRRSLEYYHHIKKQYMYTYKLKRSIDENTLKLCLSYTTSHPLTPPLMGLWKVSIKTL